MSNLKENTIVYRMKSSIGNNPLYDPCFIGFISLHDISEYGENRLFDKSNLSNYHMIEISKKNRRMFANLIKNNIFLNCRRNMIEYNISFGNLSNIFNNDKELKEAIFNMVDHGDGYIEVCDEWW